MQALHTGPTAQSRGDGEPKALHPANTQETYSKQRVREDGLCWDASRGSMQTPKRCTRKKRPRRSEATKKGEIMRAKKMQRSLHRSARMRLPPPALPNPPPRPLDIKTRTHPLVQHIGASTSQRSSSRRRYFLNDWIYGVARQVIVPQATLSILQVSRDFQPLRSHTVHVQPAHFATTPSRERGEKKKKNSKQNADGKQKKGRALTPQRPAPQQVCSISLPPAARHAQISVTLTVDLRTYRSQSREGGGDAGVYVVHVSLIVVEVDYAPFSAKSKRSTSRSSRGRRDAGRRSVGISAGVPAPAAAGATARGDPETTGGGGVAAAEAWALSGQAILSAGRHEFDNLKRAATFSGRTPTAVRSSRASRAGREPKRPHASDESTRWARATRVRHS